MTHPTPRQIADQIAREVRASAHGVAITTALVDGVAFYVIWRVEGDRIREHRLCVSTTTSDRLRVHAVGFIQNLWGDLLPRTIDEYHEDRKRD